MIHSMGTICMSATLIDLYIEFTTGAVNSGMHDDICPITGKIRAGT